MRKKEEWENVPSRREYLQMLNIEKLTGNYHSIILEDFLYL